MEDSRSELETTTGHKPRRSTRMSKPPERFKPYAKDIKPDGNPTRNFGKQSATSSTQPRAEAMESECVRSATNASECGAQILLGEQPTHPSEQAMLGAAEVECIPRPAEVSDGICRNNLVSHDEGTSDKSVMVQRFLPSPGMDSDPSAPLETSTSSMSLATMGKDMASGTNVSGDSTREGFSYIHRRSSKEAADNYCNPQDPPDRVNLSTKEPTAMPVVATSSRDEDLIATTRIRILDAAVDHTIDLDAGTIWESPIHSKKWKEPDKTDAQHNEHKEELDCVIRSIEPSGIFCRNTAVQRCTSGKRNDLPEPEPTTEPVTSYLGVPVPSTQKPEIKDPTTRNKLRLAAIIFPESFRPTTATLAQSRLACRYWSA